MPIMDGFESVRRYRAFEQSHLPPDHKPLFILGMSANNDDEAAKDAIAAGMNAFLAKPYNYQQLADVLMRSEFEVPANRTSRPITPPLLSSPPSTPLPPTLQVSHLPPPLPPPLPPLYDKSSAEDEGSEQVSSSNLLSPGIVQYTQMTSGFFTRGRE
jgi:CheY-like chemotaxis protein